MRYLFAALFTIAGIHAHAQFEGFRQWYPIGEDPDINYKTSYVKSETILFEGNPNARFSIFNNMRSALSNYKKEGAWAVYIAFKPQFRMYTDVSRPVKMPTYKAQLGIQRMFRVSDNNEFLSVALESGHYSNGQAGSAFSDKFDDGSRQGDSIYTTITSQSDLSAMLNRRNGNFSTNITELNFNYRCYKLYSGSNYVKWGYSASVGLVLYNDKLLGIANIGGYSDDDIALYGHMRYQFGYEITRVLRNPDDIPRPKTKDRSMPRMSLSERIELITDAHPSVAPLRSETRVSYAPGGVLAQDLQVFAGYIMGHDNYNFRFVDAGNQFTVGISWCIAPPPYIGRKADVDDDEGSADSD